MKSRALARLACCAALLGAWSGAGAQMADPTRPPPGYAPEGAGSGDDGSPSGQILVISRDRKFAVINGQTVALGGRYQGSTVVSITDQEVVLKGNGPVQVIKLYASIDKRMRGPSDVGAAAAGRTDRQSNKAAPSGTPGNEAAPSGTPRNEAAPSGTPKKQAGTAGTP